ncbi:MULTISPECIES: nucleotidyltransferase family protein [unclassified Methanoregula]|uniref:nucleotidyltransferase family protein n=1 Tax=unclassified Methanoregula TaxID=2649730 RepID=UPI0009D32055|nr:MULTISPECIES: nucleotidyltransferase family protein [unclassified Methanoregula]OPX63137.1 MAG: Nucleotidyltransferase domain protein [Methanoregula sp. PtaB.Bin085]OPY33436.1 MAG: Nucleotidyltransferase domain protein [Methanoregula sp. PtaU1.Bin006]
MPGARPSRKKQSVDEIRQKLQAHLPDLRSRYGITYLGIFGSYVRGEQKTTSDVDILVEFNRPGTLLGFIHLQNDLEDLLGVRVDLVEKNGLKPAIRPHVLGEVIVV